MTRNEFELLYAIKKNGAQSCRRLSALTGLSIGYISKALNSFSESGFTDSSGITDEGLAALAPYKVDNAVIMAAGLSSRFVPLSLEKPKGLLTVKGEILIERQIKQLKADEEPKAEFVIADGDGAVAVYEYCNLHGLWVKEV